MASGTIYSPIWAGYPDSNGSWSFQAKTTYSTSETPTTFTITIGATYLRQTREADVHGNGGWHAGAVLRSSAYRRVSDKVKQPTVTTGYLGIVNNVNSTDLYFANASTYKQVGSGGSMTIAKTHSARYVYLNGLGYRSTTKGNFNGLAEGINTGDNATAGTSVAIQVPAMGKYTITYNTNGGDAVASTSQFLDTNATITSTIPTKTNYTFKGWSTTNGGAVNYASGSTYTAKTNITLYAVWEYNYGLEKNPITAQRTSDDSTDATITGTYNIVGNGANVGTINAVYKRVSGTTDWGASLSCTINQGNNSKTSGTTSHTVSFSISGLTGIDTDKSYDVKVVVQDQHNNTIEPQSYISQAYYTMDFQRGGREIAFGAPASDDLTNHPKGLFRCDMDVQIDGKSLVEYILDAISSAVPNLFSFTLSANTSVPVSGLWVWTKVPFNLVHQASGTFANTTLSNGSFTIPKSGWYRIDFSIATNNAGVYIGVAVNGVLNGSSLNALNPQTSFSTASSSRIMHLNKGDTVCISFCTSSAGAPNFAGGINTRVTVEEVGGLGIS